MVNDLKLPDKVKNILHDLVTALQGAYGDDLTSVILYGSAASGEFSAVHSNVNCAVILRDTSLPALGKIVPILNKGKFRRLNAIFLTEAYIKNSADVFPVEFLDMKENHRILYGKDVLAGLNIDIKNLRFQCEQELKSKIINIKRAYLTSMNSPDLDKLLLKFFTASLHILRNILRLKNGRAVYRKEDILNGIAGGFHIDVSNMKKILEAKSANRRLPRKAARELFVSIVGDLEKISDAVDRL